MEGGKEFWETPSLPTIPWKEVGARLGLRSLLPMDKTRGNCLKLRQGRFIQENPFAERVVLSWHGLPRDVVESLPWNYPKKCLDVARGDAVQW